jgi:pyridoxamine 5'-phosphate oxidase
VGIADFRLQYETAGLDATDLDPDPVRQLLRWYDEAENAGATEPNAMVLATVDSIGLPDARVVLARNIDDTGITFYTNRLSTKGEQIEASGKAAVVFAWLQLHRQVRVRGTVSEVNDATSDAYFASRPRDSQIGAWASEQSTALSGRDELDGRVAEVTARFEGVDVPRPPHWGGYVINFESVEFWQGRPNRLHDRFRYTRTDQGWAIRRLSP